MLERDYITPGRSAALGENGMAATSHPLATLAAIDMLRSGGNAMDAAIAAVAVLCVVEPAMTGIGGDCFALVAPADGRPITAFNGSGWAPAATSAEALRASGLTSIPETSPHAVTIPGAVDAWCQLSDAYGSRDFAQLLAPAIAFAEDGFRVTGRVARDWALYRARVEHHAPARDQFLPGGAPPTTGDRFANPALAQTLRNIAARGRSAFYEGPVADELVATLTALGGGHSLDDFAEYRGFTTAPISGAFRQHELLECPPNGQGLAALVIARILDGFDLSDDAVSEADRIHLLAEATKAAYRLRDTLIADPQHMPVSVEDLLDDGFIDGLRAKIDRAHASPPGFWDGPVHRDTVYLTIVDRDRNAVSLINSIFASFGSGIYAPQSRRAAAEPRQRLLARRRASQRTAAAQAPAPHHHSGHADARWRARHALRRHGRAVSGHRPRPLPQPRARSRLRPATRQRGAAQLCLQRRAHAGACLWRRRARRSRSARPSHRLVTRSRSAAARPFSSTMRVAC